MSASSSFRRGGRGLLQRNDEAEMDRLGTGTVAMRIGGRGMSAALEMGSSRCRIGRTMIVVRRLGSFYRELFSLRLTLQTRGQQQLHAKDEVGRRVGFGWAAQILIAIEDAVVQLKY